MTEASAPSLTETLRHLRSWLVSLKPSELSPKQLEDMKPRLEQYRNLVKSFPVEVAESRASDKQLAFQHVFETRRNSASEPVDIFVAMGGNRSGKSIVCGWLCMAKHLRYRAKDGETYWCVAQNLERSISGQQRELSKALPEWKTPGQKWDEKLGFGQHRKLIISTEDGGKATVEFRSADQDLSTFEQAKLSGVWIDERIPEALYDRLLPRIVDLDGWILYSDIPEQWWHVSRLKEAAPGSGVHWVRFRMFDNEHNLAAGSIAKLSGRISRDEAKMRIEGEFVISEGLVYKEFDDNRHIIKPFPIPKHWPKWRVIDYGSSAPTACTWCAIGPTEVVYVYREHYDAGHSVGHNAQRIIAASGPEVYRKTYMDPHAVDTAPAVYGMAPSVASQYAQAGIPSTGWPFVNVMGEEAMVQKVKFALENDRLKVFSTCTSAIREFRSWMYVVDKSGKVTGKYENANNHILDTIKGFLGTNPMYTHGGLVESYSGQGGE